MAVIVCMGGVLVLGGSIAFSSGMFGCDKDAINKLGIAGDIGFGISAIMGCLSLALSMNKTVEELGEELTSDYQREALMLDAVNV